MAEFNQVHYSGDRLRATLELAEGIAKRWSVEPALVKMAREICRKYGTRTREDEGSAIRDWITTSVKYFRDPYGAEMVSDPFFTMKNGGDCDDQAVLAVVLLRALGHEAVFAAVQWQGKPYATHAICVDMTTLQRIDPVSVAPELWPPVGYQVAKMFYLRPDGSTGELSGLFSKLHKKIAKAFTKVFKPKTFLGKVADPLGLMNPKRNLELGGKIADVLGTAALVVAGGYAVGAAAGGTAGGFWSTVGKGATMVGSKLATGAKVVGAKLATIGKAVAPVMLQAISAKQAAGQPLTAQEYGYMTQVSPEQATEYGIDTTGYEYTGGGGGGGSVYGGTVYDAAPEGEPEANPEGQMQAVEQGGIPWGLVAAGVAGILVISAMSGGRNGNRKG